MTDVADAAWIAQLVEHGLVRPASCRPPPIRELRELTRYRKTQIQDRSREVQRSGQGAGRTPGPELSRVATDIIGVSGRAMLQALVAGTHDPERRWRCWTPSPGSTSAPPRSSWPRSARP